MFDITSDPALEIARVVREAEERVTAKLKALQLGEAFAEIDASPLTNG